MVGWRISAGSYVIKFKLNGTKEDALKQIQDVTIQRRMGEPQRNPSTGRKHLKYHCLVPNFDGFRLWLTTSYRKSACFEVTL